MAPAGGRGPLLLLSADGLRAVRYRRLPAWTEWLGLGLSLVALLGLSLTSHAAARTSWRALATTSDTLHQCAVALWIGGLAHVVLAWLPPRTMPSTGADETASRWTVLRRFSRLALVLVVVAIGTGVANAGLVLPDLRSLWTSRYGDVLLIKVAVLVPPLLLATFHRRALARPAMRLRQLLGTTLRLETALVLIVALGGAMLALLAPPLGRVSPLTHIALVAEVGSAPEQTRLRVFLDVRPVKLGHNTFRIHLKTSDNEPVPAGQVPFVRLAFTSLNHPVAMAGVTALPDGTGGYTLEGSQLSLDGWWRLTATVRRLGRPDTAATFYLLLPDPNVAGFAAMPSPRSDPAARALYERGTAATAACAMCSRWSTGLVPAGSLTNR